MNPFLVLKGTQIIDPVRNEFFESKLLLYLSSVEVSLIRALVFFSFTHPATPM